MRRLSITFAATLGATLLACAPLTQAQQPAAAPAPVLKPVLAPVLTLPQAQLEKLLSAYVLIRQQYVGRVDDDRLFDGALSGMLAALDAHSQYLSKEDMQDIEREESGAYVGIGIAIEVDHDRMRISNVVPGSPAERAGVRPGDVVAAIDGTPLGGLSNAEASRRMHGATGTQVSLALIPANQGATRTVAVTRAALQATTVRVRQAAPGLAWIRIDEFGGTTGAELSAVLKQLDAAGAPRGVILDLRNNPGGTLPSAIAAAGAFLPEKAVVFTARGRDGSLARAVTVEPRYYHVPGTDDVLAGLPAWTRSVPLTVLVNGSSASAAELLAAALQDHGRARLVGTQTFGKGSIQSVIALDSDSGVKFTIARYFSPNGHEIQAHGVTPDLVVAAPAAAGADLLPREADLANHLAPVDEAAATAPVRSAAESASHFGTGDDAAMKAAVALLGGKETAPQRRPTLVARLRQWTNRLDRFGASN